MSIDVLNRLLVASEWAEQVSNRGGIPSRVREAAQGQSYSISQARAAVAELIAVATRVSRSDSVEWEKGAPKTYEVAEDDMALLISALAACKASSNG